MTQLFSRLRSRIALSVLLSLAFSVVWVGNAVAQSHNLDQIRNGSRTAPLNPPDWVNGAANKTQAHFAEGYSQAYRLVITGLSLGANSITIEWDTKSSGKHGIDFITHYQRLLPHTPIFGHAAETIQPLLGLAGTFSAPSTFLIPTPSGTNNGKSVATIFESLPASERLMTIYNGAITSMSYPLQEDLTLPAAKTRLTINYVASDTTVVLAWGGHIARSTDWGLGLSAASINGSSYHMRLAVGNQQDKQLSADAVVALNCGDSQVEQCTTNEACGVAFCDPDLLTCTIGVADAGTVCSAGGVCSNDAVCDGSNTFCPANTFKPAATICRPSQGVCDVAEYCTGNSADCPANGFVPQGSVCGGDVPGSCSDPGVCSGTSAQCGLATPKAQGTLCRAASGVCDVADFCDGVSTSCPDAVHPAGMVCDTASGVCANDPICDGVTKVCQVETFKNSETVCRGTAGVCDLAETCTGTSAHCPADQFASNSIVCRGSGGACDPAEYCSGSSAACPADAKNTGICRPASGICDIAEFCDGINNTCPGDILRPAGNVCRASAGVCDMPETCTGTSAACPTDSLRPQGYACRPAVAACDQAEVCDGVSVACPADSLVAAGTQCRDGDGLCNPAEMCTGTSGFCPGDITFQPNGDTCTLSGLGICRTAGFWGTHGGTEKQKSINITQMVIDFALYNLAPTGPLNICGEKISTTKLNDAASAIEALCVPVKGDQELQLARQLTAAALNCAISGYHNCVGYPQYEYLYSECNILCDPNAAYQPPVDVGYCINSLDCLNNGGTILEGGYCKTGTCSDNPNMPCNGGDLSFCGTDAICVPDVQTCHDQPLCLHVNGQPVPGTPCFPETGPAGSAKMCNDANKNKCTIIGPGEYDCKVDSAP